MIKNPRPQGEGMVRVYLIVVYHKEALAGLRFYLSPEIWQDVV
jgi:hypothetical protein